VDFDSPDNAPSHLILMLLVPEEKGAQHLQILADLAKVFRQSDLRDELLKAETAERVCQILAIG